MQWSGDVSKAMSDVPQKPMYSIIEKFCNPKTFQ